MPQQGKILVDGDRKVDLNRRIWRDDLFGKALAGANAVSLDQAMTISRFVKGKIAKMTSGTITLPIIDQMIREKAMELGCGEINSVTMDPSIFEDIPLNLSENAIRVLERRYLRKDSEGRIIETAEQMFYRVAHHIAEAEINYGNGERVEEMAAVFYRLMTEFKFLPNSPTLMNAGRRLGQLAACFVLPVEDSMEGIFESLKNAAIIHKSGGGTGFSFSRLRPKNSRVGTTGGVASGPVSFMKVFNTATEQVKQGGTRRGANMAILRVDHPDVMEFIQCKSNGNELNNFNISVGMTDAFMEAVKADLPYALIDPRTQRRVKEVSAREVYEAIVDQAWKTGDPGIVFLDRINQANPTPGIGEIESTNPCGEQPLLPMEACNLGSVNLARFVVETEEGPVIDYDDLRETIGIAVRFLDNTIDKSIYPIEEINRMVKSNRKIGLGVMGFADLLFRLGIPYDSDQGLALAEQVMSFFQAAAHDASRELAEARGVFKNFDKSVYRNRPGQALRNATVTTIAPTGTLSIIAGCSSGIEPLFALCFTRNIMDNDKLTEVNPCFEDAARKRHFYSDDLMAEVAGKGSIQEMAEIPSDVKRVFVTAHDVTPEWHIRMQAAFQRHTDNAVSKTVNLRENATRSDVKKVYSLAYDLGCKGVTIYRDGSKDRQVLTVKKRSSQNGIKVRERPDTLNGFTTKVKTGLGDLYVTVSELDGKPFEVFAIIGKSGRSATAKTEAIGRLISLALRSGVGVKEISDQLDGIGGEHPIFRNGGLVRSIPDAISQVLRERYVNKDGTARRSGAGPNHLSGVACPECGGEISFEEGCLTCRSCGYSKCG